MFGSYATGPLSQGAGSVCAIGACAMGHSPPTESDCVLERYGQKCTESEFETPAGQVTSANGEPFTGFSGTGGLTVAPGAVVFAHTAGPGMGSVNVPVRTPHQSFCASRGVAVLLLSPSSVVLRTPNALSVMLLWVTDEAAAPTRRTPAPSRRFPLFSAWLPTA